MTEEQRFYSEDISNYNQPKPRPDIDPFINEELGRIGGTCVFGDNRFRVAWMAEALKKGYLYYPDGTEYVGDVLKYPLRTSQTHVFVYKDKSGVEGEVASADKLPPPEDIEGLPLAKDKIYNLGRLRWILEVKFTLEELIKLGEYPAPDSAEGKRFGVKKGLKHIIYPDVRGEYVGKMIFQDAFGNYRCPDREWLEKFHAHFHESTTLDREQLRALDEKREQEREKDLADAKEKGKKAHDETVFKEIDRMPVERVFSLPSIK